MEEKLYDKEGGNNNNVGIVVLVGVLLLLLGFAGWKWYGQTQEYKDNINLRDQQIGELEKQISSLEKITASVNQKTGNSNETTNDGQYLVIKEWVVRFPVSEHTNDIVYVVEDIQGRPYVKLSKQSFIQKYGENCKPEATGFGMISRGQTGQSTGAGPDSVFGTYADEVKLGDTYYGFIGPQAVCGSVTSEDNSEVTVALQELKEQIQKLEPIGN